MKSIISLFTILLIISLVIYTLLISIPSNIVSFNYSVFKKSKLIYYLPQGWAFFTRNPREDQITVYLIENEFLHNISLKTTDKNQLFGIKRENRYIQDKLGNVISEIEGKFWFKTVSNYDYVDIKDSINHLSVSVRHPSICGTYLIEVKKIMPWSYFKSGLSQNINIDTKLVNLSLICENNYLYEN
jgi:antimicrobial peptide system SdpA family protein